MPATTFTLHSPETGTDYHLRLEAPAAAEHDSAPLPAVFFMDGDDRFSFAVAADRALRRAREIPPLLLVGVGYGASYAQAANKRGRDYTPAAHADEPSSGGADAFLAFRTRTLRPELPRRHPLRADARGIAGHSLGSLLVRHALFREPPFVTHYLARAPSIWWDDRSLLRLAAARHRRNSSLPARLFLTVGHDDSSSMTGDLTLLETQPAAQPFRDLRVAARRFPGRHRYDVLPDAFRTGLATLFSSRRNLRSPRAAHAAPSRPPSTSSLRAEKSSTATRDRPTFAATPASGA